MLHISWSRWTPGWSSLWSISKARLWSHLDAPTKSRWADAARWRSPPASAIKKISVSRNGKSSNSLWAIASKAKCQSTIGIHRVCYQAGMLGGLLGESSQILLDKQGDSAMNPWHRVEVSMYLIKVILNYSMAENDKMGTLSVSWEIKIIPKIDLIEVWLKAPTHNIHNFERQWSQLISPRHRWLGRWPCPYIDHLLHNQVLGDTPQFLPLTARRLFWCCDPVNHSKDDIKSHPKIYWYFIDVKRLWHPLPHLGPFTAQLVEVCRSALKPRPPEIANAKAHCNRSPKTADKPRPWQGQSWWRYLNQTRDVSRKKMRGQHRQLHQSGCFSWFPIPVFFRIIKSWMQDQKVQVMAGASLSSKSPKMKLTSRSGMVLCGSPNLNGAQGTGPLQHSKLRDAIQMPSSRIDHGYDIYIVGHAQF